MSADAATALAYWATGPGSGELRTETLPEPGPDEALVRTVVSGVSRGTEMLVRRGGVPASQVDRMRAPFQSGTFPFPVKYGYLSVGVVERGPDDWLGARVFCLHPHQDLYVVPVSALARVPDDVPSGRAVLAGTAETALNALWDAPPCAGDRIAVVGGGLVGGAVALLLGRFPLARLQVVEDDPERRAQLAAVGLDAVPPPEALPDCDLVFHASASEPGLALALSIAGDDGTVVELSWFGSPSPRVPLGEDFHARRLSLTASQVSRVGAARRSRRDTASRLRTALELLADPAFDILLGAEHPFGDITAVFDDLDHHRAPAGCPVLTYPQPTPPAGPDRPHHT
ncbi:zinc-dependent alcohol dehydrogenase [Serinicoccus kebangsaanensis]|uniref:zinc-dependent alcohol dehydrogenase n=1 Tax=Serinicoccus kebangsaanensis TaxID=2602069 RepID=UPI00124DB63B|nr:zinc-binding alcohol dehydrogenase [Serinicoccus kebangsaanensis]